MRISIVHKIIGVYRESFKDLSQEIWILSLAMLVNRIGSMVLPFLSIYLTDALGWELTQAGVVLSIFGLGSLSGSYIGGTLTDKIGYFKVQVGSMILGGIMFWILSTVGEFYMFCGVMFITSTVLESFRPANFVAVGEYSNEENVTRSFSLVRLAVNLGYGIGPAVGGILIGTVGYTSLFVIDGFSCIAAGMLLFILLNRSEVKKQRIKKELVEKSSIQKFSIWSDKLYLVFILCTSICAIVFFQLISTAPVYMKEICGLSEQSVGYLFAFNGILIFFIEMPVVFLLEKKYDAMQLVLFGAVLILFSMISFALMPAIWMAAFVYMCFITVGEVFNFPFGNSWAALRADSNHRGKFMAMYTMSFSVAFILAPALGSFLADKLGWQAMWSIMSFICVIALIGYWVVIKLIEKEK